MNNMNNSTDQKLKATAIFIYKILKPDYLKTTGWLLITSGIVLIIPSYIQYIVLSFLNITAQGLSPEQSDKSIGLYLIGVGIHLKLLYEARSTNRVADARIITWLVYFGTLSFTIFSMRYA